MDKATASGALHAGSNPAGRDFYESGIMRKQRITISVIGGSRIDAKAHGPGKVRRARMIAGLDCILVCGGLGWRYASGCQGELKRPEA